MGNYQELVFYQKARQVVKAVNALIKTWPNTMQAQEISRQLFRSATSVGANIAEGHGRHQGTEYVHYLIIAQGSANETEHWLHTAQDCELGNSGTINEILKLNNEVIRMLISTIHTIRSNQVSKGIREESTDYITEANPISND
jgi:four helix bundle protein